MLAIVAELFPVLVALYLVDAFAWVGADQVLYVSRWATRFRQKGAGLRWAGLLPFEQAFVAPAVELVASAEGIWLPPERAAAGARFDPARCRRLAWSELRDVRDIAVDGAWLAVGPERRKQPSTAHAADLAASLRRLRDAERTPAQRERQRAKELAHGFDLKALAARREELAGATGGLLLVELALFWALFALLPTAVYLRPSAVATFWVLVLTGGLYLTAVGAAARALRRLRRAGAVRAEGLLPSILFSPPAAARALCALGRDLTHGFAGMTVAASLLPAEVLLPLLRAEVHGAAAAAARGDDGWRRAWSERRSALLGLAAAAGLAVEAVLAPPPRQDPEAAGYCPLCDAEYRAGEGEGDCADCGLPLLAFSAAPPSPA